MSSNSAVSHRLMVRLREDGAHTCVASVKCTRQRCRLAPGKTCVSVPFRPSWASLVTNCTPCRLRRDQAAKEFAPSAKPSTSRSPVSHTLSQEIFGLELHVAQIVHQRQSWVGHRVAPNVFVTTSRGSTRWPFLSTPIYTTL